MEGLEDSWDGGFAVDTSERGRIKEALWTEEAAAVIWELGGLGNDSKGGRESGVLCLDLGEGWGEGLGKGWISKCTGVVVMGWRQRRGEG